MRTRTVFAEKYVAEGELQGKLRAYPVYLTPYPLSYSNLSLSRASAAASASDAEQLRAVADAAEPAPAASGGLKDVDMLLVLLDTSSKEETKPPEIETVESWRLSSRLTSRSSDGSETRTSNAADQTWPSLELIFFSRVF